MNQADARRKKRDQRADQAERDDEDSVEIVYAKPIVAQPLVLTKKDLNLKTKKGKKRASSSRARRLENVERNVSKAVRRVSRGVDHGVNEYIDARDRSARRRKDGALVDLYENVAKGLSVGISESSPALRDLARSVNTKMTRRQIRRLLNGLPRLPIIG